MTAAFLTAAVVVSIAAAYAPTGPQSSRWRRRRDDRRVGRDLPDLLDEVARSMRAGLSVRSALVAARAGLGGPLAADVDGLLGSSTGLRTALGVWAEERRGVPGVRLVAVALATVEQTGAAARAVDSVADTLRADREVAAEVRALASQAQASAAVIAVLPVGFAAVASIADPATLRFLVDSSIGRLCLAIGVALDLAAFVWMRRIVRSVR